MDLIVSCSCSSTSSSLFRPKSTPLQSPFFPSIPNPSATSSRRLKWAPPRTKSELQTPVGVNGRSTTVTPTAVPTHKVTVHDRQRGVVHEFVVPEDQYILHTAESQDITLPFACRHGCCTSCAVRVKSGQLRQPEALGISTELKDKAWDMHCFVSGSRLQILKSKHKTRMRYIGFSSGDILLEGLLNEMTTLWSWPWLTNRREIV
ncbi:unnamed protein product [Linum tenue]|uniref:2Fe-2S ferredoxin-type domain-containing protein n=1 Tax=Linum tenue TaxID=586396 RepID=A0AAV0K895_9ROSI|nr:unnamed protein product [Linum tenue]